MVVGGVVVVVVVVGGVVVVVGGTVVGTVVGNGTDLPMRSFTVVPLSTSVPGGTLCEMTRPSLGSPMGTVWKVTLGTSPTAVS